MPPIGGAGRRRHRSDSVGRTPHGVDGTRQTEPHRKAADRGGRASKLVNNGAPGQTHVRRSRQIRHIYPVSRRLLCASCCTMDEVITTVRAPAASRGLDLRSFVQAAPMAEIVLPHLAPGWRSRADRCAGDGWPVGWIGPIRLPAQTNLPSERSCSISDRILIFVR